MKTLVLGIVFIVLVGLGGFLYRNVLERPVPLSSDVCTGERLLCADGSYALQSPPNCESVCPEQAVFPEYKMAFLVPAEYAADPLRVGKDESLVTALTNTNNTIGVYAHPLKEEESVEEQILSLVTFQPSGLKAEDFEQVESLLINGNSFKNVTVERFEGVVQSLYFLEHNNNLFVFEIVERNVANWTDPDLAIEELEGHKTLLSLLQSLALEQ